MKIISILKFIIILKLIMNISGCSWVNAAGRVYEGAGQGLTRASNETEPSFSKKLFGVGGKISTAVGRILVDASGNNSESSSQSLNSSERKKVVTEVQGALNNRGYNTGSVDGLMGVKTANAIRQYQRDNGLEVSGSITKDLINSLNIQD